MSEEEEVLISGDAATIKRESARRTRRSFLVGGIAAAGAASAAYLVDNSRPIGRLQAGLRHTLNANAAVSRTLLDRSALAPEYSVSEAVPLRLNGVVGLEKTLLVESWRLQLAGVDRPHSYPQFAQDVTAWEYKYRGDLTSTAQAQDFKTAPQPAQKSALNPTGATDSPAAAALAERAAAAARQQSTKRNQGDAEAGPSASSLDIGTPGLLLTMEDLLRLPRVSFVTQFKCIEGWSSITQWAGVRLRDLIAAYPPQRINGRLPSFVYMETPEGDFYTGYNMSAALHPQSLLVTEMGGQPLTQEHGAPLRLHMPSKYGYKQIKRIGLIAYTDTKPDDYWTKLGYDWYAGL